MSENEETLSIKFFLDLLTKQEKQTLWLFFKNKELTNIHDFIIIKSKENQSLENLFFTQYNVSKENVNETIKKELEKAIKEMKEAEEQAIVEMEKSGVNLKYQYEDVDIQAILKARLEILKNPHTESNIEIWAIIDNLENPGETSLKKRLEQIKGSPNNSKTHLIPFNVGGGHWVGILLELGLNGELKRAEYMDSLTTSQNVIDALKAQLQAVYPNAVFTQPENTLKQTNTKQTDYTSCGAYTIENLLASALKINPPENNNIAIRKSHLDALEKNNSEYHKTFKPKQLENTPKIQSAQVQISANNSVVFTKESLGRIEKIKNFLNSLDGNERTSLVTSHTDNSDVPKKKFVAKFREMIFSKSSDETNELQKELFITNSENGSIKYKDEASDEIAEAMKQIKKGIEAAATTAATTTAATTTAAAATEAAATEAAAAAEEITKHALDILKWIIESDIKTIRYFFQETPPLPTDEDIKNIKNKCNKLIETQNSKECEIDIRDIAINILKKNSKTLNDAKLSLNMTLAEAIFKENKPDGGRICNYAIKLFELFEVAAQESQRISEKLSKAKEEESANIMQFFGKDAFSNSAKKRGLAFITGASPIIKNTKEEDFSESEDKVLTELNKITTAWGKIKNHNSEDINELQHLLNSALESGIKGFNSKNALQNAENHIQWGKRETVDSIIEFPEVDNVEYCQERIDVPITKLTQEQTAEWMKILDNDDLKAVNNQLPKSVMFTGSKKQKPTWFTKLATWEQNHLMEKVKSWNPNKVPNLGDHLGVPPTTVRGYPGARNAYTSTFITYKKENGNWIEKDRMVKIRTGHVVPDKMKNKNERLEQTKNNIKQLMLVQIQNQLERSDNVLISLQTLITPIGMIRKMTDDYHLDDVRKKAVKELKKEFKTPDAFKTFLSNNGVNTQDKSPKLTFITSNHSVNKGRFFNLAGGENRETREKLNSISAGIGNSKAKSALEKMEKIRGLRRVANLFSRGMNHNAERAALEQIAVDALGGMRIGSCMSGKDREGAVSMLVAATNAFYAKHGNFPPIPPFLNTKDKVLRNEYENMVAAEFASRHDIIIADVNALGATGLKEAGVILGKNIMNKAAVLIREKATEGSISDLTGKRLSEQSNKTAKLNKPKSGGKTGRLKEKIDEKPAAELAEEPTVTPETPSNLEKPKAGMKQISEKVRKPKKPRKMVPMETIEEGIEEGIKEGVEEPERHDEIDANMRRFNEIEKSIQDVSKGKGWKSIVQIQIRGHDAENPSFLSIKPRVHSSPENDTINAMVTIAKAAYDKSVEQGKPLLFKITGFTPEIRKDLKDKLLKTGVRVNLEEYYKNATDNEKNNSNARKADEDRNEEIKVSKGVEEPTLRRLSM